MTAFDTIETAKRLAKEYEFSEKQAEGIIVVMRDSVVGDLATKEDVRRLEKDVQGLEGKMALTIEAAISRHGKEILDKMDSRFAEMEVRFREMEVRFREMDKRFHQTMVLTLLAIGVATAVVSAVIAL